MQTKKMSLANIQGKLSRTEMKNIMAGSGSITGGYCSGSVGAWTYNSNSSLSQCLADIRTYCSSGYGRCTR